MGRSVSPASRHPPHLPPASAVSLSPNHTLRPSLRSLYLLRLFQPSCSSPFCCYRPVRSAGSSLPGVVSLSLTTSRSFAHIRFYTLNGFNYYYSLPRARSPSWQFHALTRLLKPPEPSELLDPEYPATGFTQSLGLAWQRDRSRTRYKGWVEDDFSMSLKELDTFWIPELANRR